ncbi:hypothetical protein DFH06DRAFT_1308020 [Mycena polygramma]|nr:hypothetical protein DFH06DRAFT_1308020 [Mycena polygramma]
MDVDNEPIPTSKGIDPGEAAAADIWAIYVAEAEKYDKGLVESWRSDMDGMLIFAGLFSASLTAFLIESYKTLNLDSGDTTVKLLAQISQQLAASTQGSALDLPAVSTDFTPSPAALVCNALWFISLGLSLSCALFATLLEQWARDFIHRTEIRSAPLIRARIFSFLYYGLKRFNMHMLVDIIPLLLHLALFFFFAGLVAFLIPVNLGMAILAGGILLILTAAYSVFTLFPLAYLQSPYRTPLSGTFWRLAQFAQHWRRGQSHPPSVLRAEETIMEAVSRVATEDSEERMARDEQALTWTMKSLSDDQELEPFVAAIPNILWGPEGRRDRYTAAFRSLATNPELHLFDRINGLLAGCDTGLLLPDVQKRRQVVHHNAVWAMAASLPPSEATSISTEWAQGIQRITDNGIFQAAVSARALMQCSRFHAHVPRLQHHLRYLVDSLRRGCADAALAPVSNSIAELIPEGHYPVSDPFGPYQPFAVGHSAEELIHQIECVLIETPYRIFFEYLVWASRQRLDALPYRFYATCEIILAFPQTVTLKLQAVWDYSLADIVSRVLKESNVSDLVYMDALVQQLMSCWSPHGNMPIPLIQYIGDRACGQAVALLFDHTPDIHQLCDEMTLALLHETSESARNKILTAMWRLMYHSGWRASTSWLRQLHGVVTEMGVPSISASLTALLKWRYLQVLRDDDHELDPSYLFAQTSDSLHPTVTAITEPLRLEDGNDAGVKLEDYKYLCRRNAEAYVLILLEFVDACASPEPFPYKVDETLQRITVQYDASHFVAVHESYQIRLSNAIQNAFCSPRCAQLRGRVINSTMFDMYSRPILGSAGCPWLTNKEARERIKTVLASYADELACSPEQDFQLNSDLDRVRAILQGLESFHTTTDNRLSLQTCAIHGKRAYGCNTHPGFLRKSDTLVSVRAEKVVQRFYEPPALCNTRFLALAPPPNKARYRYFNQAIWQSDEWPGVLKYNMNWYSRHTGVGIAGILPYSNFFVPENDTSQEETSYAAKGEKKEKKNPHSAITGSRTRLPPYPTRLEVSSGGESASIEQQWSTGGAESKN